MNFSNSSRFNRISCRGRETAADVLPLIDSANHLQEADSVIEFDPAVDGFVLSLGRKCLVKEVDGAGEKAHKLWY